MNQNTPSVTAKKPLWQVMTWLGNHLSDVSSLLRVHAVWAAERLGLEAR